MSTQTLYRQRIARMLDLYSSGTATSGSVALTTLVDADMLVSSLDVDDVLKDWYVFRPNAATATDKVRLVDNYAPGSGTLTVDKAYAIAPYAGSGEAYELHGLVEPLNEMNDLINQALKRIMVIAEFSFTPSSTTAERHSLAVAAPWLDNPALIYQVGVLSANEVRAETDPYRVREVRHDSYVDGNVVYLSTPGVSFSLTDTVYLRVLKPAYDHCRATAGIFGERSGLRAGTETDEAVPVAEWVAYGALVEMWNRKYHTLAERYGKGAVDERERMAAMFNRFQSEYLAANLPKKQNPPIRSWGRGSMRGIF